MAVNKNGWIKTVRTVLLIYLALNLYYLVGWIPDGFLLQPFRFAVTVLDEETQQPLDDAEVQVMHTYKGTESPWFGPSMTDVGGKANVSYLTIERANWGFPQLGYFKFEGVSIRVDRYGYQSKTIRLVDALPNVSFDWLPGYSSRQRDLSIGMKQQQQ